MFRVVCDPSSGSTELCLTEITRGGSQIYFACLIGVRQRNFEPVVVRAHTRCTNFKRQLKITPTCFGSCAIHHQGVLSCA